MATTEQQPPPQEIHSIHPSLKRPLSETYDDPSGPTIARTVHDLEPSIPHPDHNHWYYPAPGYESEDEAIHLSVPRGNWGRKMAPDARWVRRGKKAAWGPGIEEWETDERARKRIRVLLPELRESSASPPPSMTHLRSPSPPAEAPYAPPVIQHHSFTSFVMDRGVTQSFRSRLVEDLERATEGLVRSENPLRMALGRLWQVLADNPGPTQHSKTTHQDQTHASAPNVNGLSGQVPKREEEEDEEDDMRSKDNQVEVIIPGERRVPDLNPPAYKHFLTPYPSPPPGTSFNHLPPDAATPMIPADQQDNLIKSLASLRQLQDDGREYVERLLEIRESLGDVRHQRKNVWDTVREHALKELQDAAGVVP